MHVNLELALVRLVEHILPLVDVLSDTVANIPECHHPDPLNRPATKRDLLESEHRIIHAITTVDHQNAQLLALAIRLERTKDALKAAIAANTPLQQQPQPQ